MKPVTPKPQRCAIYTRKSTEHNLDLTFNSLDAQREACEAYIKSQTHEGWRLSPERYDDGGLSRRFIGAAGLADAAGAGPRQKNHPHRRLQSRPPVTSPGTGR
jgi:hypothetical protein